MHIYNTIIKPVITEKSSSMNQDGKYSFFVYKGADKTNVRNAIEKIYGVKVVNVRMVNTKQKTKLGKHRIPIIKKKSQKKAIVTLSKGTILDYNKLK